MGFLERIYEYIFFEKSCGYGLYPWQPIKLLLLNIPLFSIIYLLGIYSKRESVGIWKVWPEDKLINKTKSNNPTKIHKLNLRSSILYSVYFSILSAFNIGFRDFNIGKCITRLQSEDYKLKANGWIRIISGAQSIITIYFLALWALTYFGTPFN